MEYPFSPGFSDWSLFLLLQSEESWVKSTTTESNTLSFHQHRERGTNVCRGQGFKAKQTCSFIIEAYAMHLPSSKEKKRSVQKKLIYTTLIMVLYLC